MPITQLPTTCPGVTDAGLRIAKGDTKSFTLTLGQDLTSAIVSLEVRRNPLAPDVLVLKVGVIEDVPTGRVRFDFVPADVASVPAGFYIFNVLVTITGTTKVMTGQFILDPFDQALIGKLEPHIQLAVTGSTQRLSVEIRDSQGVLANPVDLRFRILDFGDAVLMDVTFPSGPIINPEAGIFYIDFQANRAGDYLVFWDYRFTGAEPVTLIRDVRFVTPTMFRFIPEILLYIDKSRKAVGSPIAFSQIDVAEYIQNSLRDFNATTPTTSLMLEELDGVLGVYKEVLVLGAVIQALIAQGLLAVDQDFTYNDNGIALNVDHSAKLLSWYQALLTQYTAKKMQYKVNFFSPSVFARTIVGNTFATAFAHMPAGTATRFRGWI